MPTIVRVRRVGESIEGIDGRCVCGPRRRGLGSQLSLRRDARPGTEAVVHLLGSTPCPTCHFGHRSACAVHGIHAGPRQVEEPLAELLALLQPPAPQPSCLERSGS